VFYKIPDYHKSGGRVSFSKIRKSKLHLAQLGPQVLIDVPFAAYQKYDIWQQTLRVPDPLCQLGFRLLQA